MKLKHSLVYSSSSGNLGGAIVASGHNGSVLYNRTRKKRAISNKQSQRRSAFLRISQAWRTLSPSVVAKYNFAAKTVKRPSFNGSLHSFTGFQLYFYVNFYRMLSGFAPLTQFLFYGKIEFAHPYSFTLVNSLSLFYFSYTKVSSLQQRVLIFATKQYAKSVNLSDNDYVFVLSWWVDNPPPYNIFSGYKAIFPDTLVKGSVIYLKCIQICSVGLPVYPTIYCSCIIT